ncbi:hypothetical protein F4821DRAFT_139653 [Hypoxylon rubiginosum]|uniref:Uncharacterized protein n=1 Tax=Hypoxylon rubiginosum TaxID=110542 RepID=A0ACC0CZZ8_9PEZI|nr:hypothetical protein F4821DRAFT_139653 [Hypoxylon rubiginosum]
MERSNVEPPPYLDRYDKLQDWQKRWNREWLTDAVIPGVRMMTDRIERNWYYKSSKVKAEHKHKIDTNRRVTEPYIAHWGLFLPGADKKGKRGLFRRALHHITLFLHLEDLKVEYRDFRKWRQERREAANKVEIVVDMEDEGNAPRWKGKMSFTMDPKLYSQYTDTDTWFPFPTPDNIRWYWVKNADNEWILRAGANGRWGPSKVKQYCMPFRCMHGTIQRNVHEMEPGAAWCECRLREDF